MLLMIDNYDSFTYNLVQYFGELGALVRVVRNDETTVDEIRALEPERIVISPGPCTPNEAGISVAVVKEFGGRIPIMGVCLGHQCIGQAFGGRIVRANRIMHGKTSPIQHRGAGLFKDLPLTFTATRYHSLVVDAASLPDCLEVDAWSVDGGTEVMEIMGIRHREWDISGVQFHPESIASDHGHAMLRNFLEGATRRG